MSAEQTVRLENVAVPLEAAQRDETAALRQAVGRRLGSAEAPPLALLKRSLDVRRQRPTYRYTVEVRLPRGLARRLCARGQASVPKAGPQRRWRCAQRPPGPPPVVVGAGPAGLFAALTLAEAGLPPRVLERGQPVEVRARQVARLYAHGELQVDSNVCYGEGGAGTFSDGKLYTRIGDPRIGTLMRALVGQGAPADILVDNRPHLGTDRLVALLKNLRRYLQSLGVTFHFGAALADLQLDGGRLRGLVLRDGSRLAASRVILCSGHSAHDIWSMLARRGLPLCSRPFAVGFRVEHPQALIDAAAYGAHAHLPLPAADYRLSARAAGRGIYSFCMCPGGVVVPTPTRPAELCINGMSHAARRGRFANSALVVSVDAGDFAAAGFDGCFAGVAFQRHCEARAYAAGGGNFVAPAARLTDFAAAKKPRALGPSSYRRGLSPADLTTLYPPAIGQALRAALPQFARSLPGFLTDEAQLIGVETRTASPVRVPRGDDLQASGAAGLYPAGEGMGYGGGIVSAAVDGMRAAEALLEAAGARLEAVATV